MKRWRRRRNFSGFDGLPVIGSSYQCLDAARERSKASTLLSLGLLEIVAQDGKPVSVKMID